MYKEIEIKNDLLSLMADEMTTFEKTYGEKPKAFLLGPMELLRAKQMACGPDYHAGITDLTLWGLPCRLMNASGILLEVPESCLTRLAMHL